MRAIILAAAVFIALTQPALAQRGRASEAERDAALDAYVNCLFEAAEQMDDGISEATTVGAAIAPLCRDRMEAMVVVYTRGRSRTVYNRFRELRLADETNMAAGAVLAVRRDGAEQTKR